ncbi:acyl-CoA dehydrogenase family protein [Streptomyces sp. L7]
MMVYRAAWRSPTRAVRTSTEAAMAKLYASEGRQPGRLAGEFRSTAATDTLRESEISRFYADAKILEIGEGTNEIQRNVIAKALVKGA